MRILCIIPLLSRRCKYADDTLIANTSRHHTSLCVRLSCSDTTPDGRSSYRWWLLSSFLTALGLHSNYAPFQKLLWQLVCWQNTLLCLFMCGQLWLPRWSGENALAASRYSSWLTWRRFYWFYSAENWLYIFSRWYCFWKLQKVKCRDHTVPVYIHTGQNVFKNQRESLQPLLYQHSV